MAHEGFGLLSGRASEDGREPTPIAGSDVTDDAAADAAVAKFLEDLGM
jgi:hypothetical protein